MGEHYNSTHGSDPVYHLKDHLNYSFNWFIFANMSNNKWATRNLEGICRMIVSVYVFLLTLSKKSFVIKNIYTTSGEFSSQWLFFLFHLKLNTILAIAKYFFVIWNWMRILIWMLHWEWYEYQKAFADWNIRFLTIP